MSRIASASRGKPTPRWHKVFMAMLPQIVTHAKYAFRNLRGEASQDNIQETVANALVAFVALVRRGKMSIAYPSVLARYAVAQVNDGRRVGNKLNVREVLSPYAQRLKGFKVDRLDHYDETDDCWQEILVEDGHATPAELAATRLDFPAWLDTLSRRNRKIALKLAEGEKTSDVARRFKISEGRISQLRKELKMAWDEFTGDGGLALSVPA